jgi:phosphonate transport system ATP-binding protein
VHQDLALVPNLRVSQNVIAGALGSLRLLPSLRAMLLPSSDDLDRVAGLLDRVGIGSKISPAHGLPSGGERQRVAIARAPVQDRGDPRRRARLLGRSGARTRHGPRSSWRSPPERGLTLVVSLHDLDLAREFFPRLVGLRQGRIAFDLPTSAIDEDRFRGLYRLEERGTRAG